MGGCCGGPRTPDDQKDANVGDQLKADHMGEKSIKKLLLLGAGGSGKSTFFKQLQRIHLDGFRSQEKLSYKSQIYEQIITQMQLLIEKCEVFVHRDPEANAHLKISEETRPLAQRVMKELRAGMVLTPEIAGMIKELWADPAIKCGYDMRAQLCVFDSSNYFFDNVERMSNEDYLPTEEDILLVRHRTTGMNEKEFTIQDTVFRIVDVGGQRSERRKWIHFFDGVTGVVFVASLSCFDEVLFEDENINVMHETLQVFTETCNSHWFQTTSFILFLNKRDLFEEKIKVKKQSIRIAFPKYDGPEEDVEAATKYIQEVFENQNASEEDREIYAHVTCAHDKNQVEEVFNDVQHIIVNKSLAKSGLL